MHFHRGDEDVSCAVRLDVDERVGHAERDLVSDLRAPEGVADDQDVDHRSDPNAPAASARSGDEIVRERGQHLAPVLGDEHEILEPHAVAAVPVEPRLDREHVTGDERLADPADRRLLVHRQPDPVTRGVEEAVAQDSPSSFDRLVRWPLRSKNSETCAWRSFPARPGRIAA